MWVKVFWDPATDKGDESNESVYEDVSEIDINGGIALIDGIRHTHVDSVHITE